MIDDDDFDPGNWKDQLLSLSVIAAIAAICYGVLKLVEWAVMP